jgi:hypothetical protein
MIAMAALALTVAAACLMLQVALRSGWLRGSLACRIYRSM